MLFRQQETGERMRNGFAMGRTVVRSAKTGQNSMLPTTLYRMEARQIFLSENSSRSNMLYAVIASRNSPMQMHSCRSCLANPVSIMAMIPHIPDSTAGLREQSSGTMVLCGRDSHRNNFRSWSSYQKIVPVMAASRISTEQIPRTGSSRQLEFCWFNIWLSFPSAYSKRIKAQSC